MVTLNHYLLLAAALFCIGLFGALSKRNAIAVLMSIELMLNAVNINLVAFSHFLADTVGQVFAIFVIAVAAAEITVGIAMVIAIYRNRFSVNVNEFNLLKW
ncbi:MULTISPECIES: NADH-quinone oxidoreductase subunit NuoK [unclassified Candidatus Frackibacter]|uniref:NADH-quinone oxidoreductase subunit NuoK n=1 Tax=unclassified Candidatus Frackibacter TaxID=2648818 RepID=UPI000791F96D|nr:MULTISPECIES: NADH-quinone oxidoreductase subunit NuoK [unclassified Candidatus Frackibacter]KXS43050.1 MAG: NADH-quinone oxidoreductase subunit K [Candidatus Frackibacter sp. T328-2]SDC80726.1 NADH dehydrogenase subunit K [Candidatus Frackibacter sp. WG11]SEM93179.1 NADH dehydrogenase subunit K [Candidatus Frackibacter sp. WG12]SFM02702.1 NADH dehydrogenase subunit K [Candidatus Frackibacter sp. WG13]